MIFPVETCKNNKMQRTQIRIFFGTLEGFPQGWHNSSCEKHTPAKVATSALVSVTSKCHEMAQRYAGDNFLLLF